MKTSEYTIPVLEKDGYTGTDASLAECLFEYGMAWKDDGKDWRFIYRHPVLRNAFDWACIAKDTTPEREWDWVNWDDVARCNGVSRAEFLAQSIPVIAFDLVNYYGTENVFGSSYTEGFQIP